MTVNPNKEKGCNCMSNLRFILKSHLFFTYKRQKSCQVAVITEVWPVISGLFRLIKIRTIPKWL